MSAFLHEAIREAHSNAVTISGDSFDDVEVWDIDGNTVSIDNDAVTVIIDQMIADNPMKMLRLERNRLLLEEVDPIVSNNLRWADMTAEKQTEWSNYRRALLDLPANQTPADDDLSNITFPTKPE